MFSRVLLLFFTVLLCGSPVSAQRTSDKKNGKVTEFADDVITEGTVRNYAAHGTFITKRAAGVVNGRLTYAVLFIENYKMGYYEGLYASFDDQGDTLLTGHYHEGRKTGVWRAYENKALTGEYHYDTNGQLTGCQYEYYTSGQRKRNSCYSAPGVHYDWVFHQSGRYYSRGGFVSDTLREGDWYYYDTTVAMLHALSMDTLPVRLASYKNGKLHGKDEFFLKGTLVSSTSYSDGLLNGKKKTYAGSVLIADEAFVNGERQGVSLYYAHNGKIIGEEPYEHDQRHGMWHIYDSLNGSVTEETKYERGVMMTQRKFSGIVIVYDCRMTEPDSILYAVKEYYPDGKPKSDARFVKGRRTGTYISWYSNGKKKQSASFNNDQYNSTVEIWNEKGVRVLFAKCNNGRDTVPEVVCSENGTRLVFGTVAYERQRAKYIPADLAGYANDLINVGQLQIHGYPAPGPWDTPFIRCAYGEWVEYSANFIGPEFQGGGRAMLSYIDSSAIYPDYERAERIEGENVVTFTVREDGSIVGVYIHRSLSPGLDQEAMRLVRNMPPWKPAVRNGQPREVRCWLEIAWELKELKKW